MRPKGKLFALLVVFTAIGLVTATGAFTTVQADRTAQVNVAGDSAALLAIQPNESNGGNGVDGSNYVQTGDTITIDFDGTDDSDLGNEGANGLNGNAKTVFGSLLNITNQGTQPVEINMSVSVTTNDVSGISDNSKISNSIIIKNTSDGTDLTSDSVTLDTGNTMTIDFIADLRDDNGAKITSGNFDLTITITADQSTAS